MVVHFKPHCNTYGSLAAYIVALLVRLSGGEPLLGLPAAIHYPGYDADEDRQLFPFRTMAMVLSLLTLIGVSWWTKWAFETGRLAPHQDYFRCVVNIPEDAIRVEEPAENGEQVCVCGSILTLGSTYYWTIWPQLSVMSGPMNRMYGAATMAGKNESDGRINPAMEPDDDLPVAEAQRRALFGTGDGSHSTSASKGQTAF